MFRGVTSGSQRTALRGMEIARLCLRIRARSPSESEVRKRLWLASCSRERKTLGGAGCKARRSAEAGSGLMFDRDSRIMDATLR